MILIITKQTRKLTFKIFNAYKCYLHIAFNVNLLFSQLPCIKILFIKQYFSNTSLKPKNEFKHHF